MDNPPDATLSLRAGEFLPLRGAQGRSVAVLRGRLWIAQERSDTFVRRGQTFRLDHPGGAMLHALEASSLRLIEALSAEESAPPGRRA